MREPSRRIWFPSFLSVLAMLLGGAIRTGDGNKELEIRQMARECCTTVEAIETYLDVIWATYTSDSAAGMIQSSDGMDFFKYVPAAFRAIGLIHRQSVGLLGGDDRLFASDSFYSSALGRALADSGGSAAER
jgi:hypothetical protein